MITEYHRPKTLEEALALLARADRVSIPLAGGSAIPRNTRQPLEVVDLQVLGLNKFQDRANFAGIGAMVTLQTLLDTAGLPGALYQAVRREAAHNLRQVATVAGTLVAADGRSPFATAMLALDTRLSLAAGVRPGEAEPLSEDIDLGDLLSFRSQRLRGRLITQATIPLNLRLAYQDVARTPADRTIVCVAIAVWPSGRTRVALGGHGPAPILALDGPEPGGAEIAARDAFSAAGDEWASAEYRQEMAGVLVRRCIYEA
jgi:CO/xanthine dehydrogenase FAD-binding subunit